MPKRLLVFAILVAALAAIVLLHHPQPVHAQSGQLQIASITLGPVQTLNVPNSTSQSPYLNVYPDEHMTFFPPASGSGPYLVSALAGCNPPTYGARPCSRRRIS